MSPRSGPRPEDHHRSDRKQSAWRVERHRTLQAYLSPHGEEASRRRHPGVAQNGAAVNVGCILEYLDAHAPAFFQSTPSIERSWTAFRKAIPWLLLPWPHSPRTISGTTKYSSSRSNGDLASPFRLHSEQSESGAADTGKSTTPASRFAVARRRGRLYLKLPGARRVSGSSWSV